MDSEARRIKTQIRQHRRNHGSIPPALRSRAARYACDGHSAGESWTSLAAELGVSRPCLRNWTRAHGPYQRAAHVTQPPMAARIGGFVHVELLPTEPRPPSLLQLVTPQGYRVEGLELSQVRDLLRSLP